MKELLMKLWKTLVASLDWREILYSAYQGLRKDLAKKVLDSASKWDDVALKALDTLVETFLKPKV